MFCPFLLNNIRIIILSLYLKHSNRINLELHDVQLLRKLSRKHRNRRIKFTIVVPIESDVSKILHQLTVVLFSFLIVTVAVSIQNVDVVRTQVELEVPESNRATLFDRLYCTVVMSSKITGVASTFEDFAQLLAE